MKIKEIFEKIKLKIRDLTYVDYRVQPSCYTIGGNFLFWRGSRSKIIDDVKLDSRFIGINISFYNRDLVFGFDTWLFPIRTLL